MWRAPRLNASVDPCVVLKTNRVRVMPTEMDDVKKYEREHFGSARRVARKSTDGTAGHNLEVIESQVVPDARYMLTVEAMAAGTLAMMDMTAFRLSNMKI